MANPITWRNVGLPNFGSSNQLQIAAGDQLNAGIAQLGRAADTYRQGQIDAEQQTKEFNTRNFLNQINGFSDIDNYDQFNQRISSELNNFNPSQVDTSSVLSALQGRDNTLRADVLERQEFSDNQAEIAARPDTRNANTLISSGKYDEAEELINNSSTIVNKSSLLDTLNSARVNAREEKFKLDERTRNLDTRTQTEQGAALLPEILRTIEDPNLVERTVTDTLTKAGITNGKVLSDLVGKARNQYNELVTLNPLAQERIDKISAQNARSLENFDRQTEALLGSTPVLAEDAKAFSDLSGSTSEAIDTLVSASTADIGTLELLDRITGDTRNPQNARSKANNAITNVVNELLGGKNKEQYAAVLQGPSGDGFIAAALGHAQGRLEYGPTNGWEQDELESELKKAIQLGLKTVGQLESINDLRNKRIVTRNKLSENYEKALERAILGARQERLGNL